MTSIKWFIISCIALSIMLPKAEWKSSVVFLVSLGVGYLAGEVAGDKHIDN